MSTALAAVVLQRTLPARLLLDVVEEVDEVEELEALVELVEPDDALLLDAALDELATVLLLLLPPQAVNTVTMPSIANRLFIVSAPGSSMSHRAAGVTVDQDIANNRQSRLSMPCRCVTAVKTPDRRADAWSGFDRQPVFASYRWLEFE